ncbi:hypothetical protein RND71_009903 [Anisodus tanguticus]|uniref:Uncharacterized protein n=1 Tax=Anisodus tanguticus TaxID=243964 RepID=A0AAE1SJB5_9SOLA|nr:hypothetical protein RND71_009903 [Anisodus tanguticus]
MVMKAVTRIRKREFFSNARVANVEALVIAVYSNWYPEKYKFPQFEYENTSLRTLILGRCELNLSGSVNRSSLVVVQLGS